MDGTKTGVAVLFRLVLLQFFTSSWHACWEIALKNQASVDGVGRRPLYSLLQYEECATRLCYLRS